MFEVNIKYVVNVFGDFSDIIPTPDNTITLLTLYREYGFLPSTFQEISSSNPTMVLRQRLSTPNNEWNVNIGVNTLSIEKIQSDELGNNMGTIDDFVDKATKIASSLLEKYNKKATRIALLSNGLFKELSNEKLTKTFLEFSKPISFYQENQPFEWNNRIVTRNIFNICDTEEDVNIITTISRLQGEMTSNNVIKIFDRIGLEFDINTIAQKSEARFDAVSIQTFLQQAIKVRNIILTEIGGVINE